MASHFTYEMYYGHDLTSELLKSAATLFSEHYGIWSTTHPSPKPGQRVRATPSKLQEQLLSPNGDITYVCARNAGELVGHVFACRWNYNGQRICWITQLLVHHKFRRQGLATKLLQKLRQPDDWGFGILSSHPAAIRATMRSFGRGLEEVNLETIKQYAADIMLSSPVGYVRTAKLHGSLFGSLEGSAVSTANTNFFVDHAEPLEALALVREEGLAWPFGELPEGHEFLLLVKTDYLTLHLDRSRDSETNVQQKSQIWQP
jgi:GNAT superfamily N-acetyltransferase